MAPNSVETGLESNKPVILRLLAEKKSQKLIREELATRDIIVTKGQLEYQLKKWGIRVNLREDAWKYIDHEIKKRKRQQGKDSDVIVSGVRLPPSKVLKETNRYGFDWTLSKFSQNPTSPNPPEDLPLAIRTPPPFRLEFQWPPSMPWLQLQQNLAGWLHGSSSLRPDLYITYQTLPNKRHFAPNLVAHPLRGILSTDIQHIASRIASVMPEAYHGEHLLTSSILLSGDEKLMFSHGARLLLFSLSNNMAEYGDYDFILDLMRTFGTSLGSLQSLGGDITARALIEKAFEVAIEQDADDVIELLMQSGLTPRRVGQGLPSTLAISHNSHRALRSLLSEGAEVDRRSFLAAIENGNADMVRLCLQRGIDANILLERDRNRRWFYSEISVLTAAIELLPSSRSETNPPVIQEFIISHHTVSVNSLVAAIESNQIEIVQLICDHGIDVNGTTDYGISPLQAAAFRDRSKICALLLKLGAHTIIPVSHPRYGTLPSVLHALMLSTILHSSGQDATLLNFLLDVGVDPDYCISFGTKRNDKTLENLSRPAQCHSDCRISSQLFRTFHTALEFGLATQRSEEMIARLLDTRPRLFGAELILGSYYLSTRAIECLLARGLNLNFVDSDGNTALSMALKGQNVAVAKLLLCRGAQVRSRDTFLAFDTRDTELQKDVLRLGNIHERAFKGKSIVKAAIEAGAAAIVIAEILAKQPTVYNGQLVRSVTLRAVSDKDLEYSQILEKLLRSRTKNTKYHALESAAIAIAAAFGRLDLTIMFKKYIPHTKDCTTNPLYLPCVFYNFRDELENQALVLAEEMSRKGSMPVAVLSFAVMARNHEQEIVEFLLGGGYLPDETTLFLAIWSRQGSGRLFRKLVRMVYASRNHSQRVRASWAPSPLQMAAYMGNIESVQILLEEGFEVEESPAQTPWWENSFLEVGGQPWLLPRTALQFAVEPSLYSAEELAEEERLELIDLLIKAGANVNAPAAPVSGATALQLASIHGHLGIARKLVELGADVNAKGADIRGRTAVEGAAEHGRIDMLHWLLASGASTIGEHRRSYIRAIRLAELEGHYAAARLLREYREWEETDHELYDEVRDVKKFDEDWPDEDWQDEDLPDDNESGEDESDEGEYDEAESNEDDDEGEDFEDQSQGSDVSEIWGRSSESSGEIEQPESSRYDSNDGFDVMTEVGTRREPAVESRGASIGSDELDCTIMAPEESCVRFEQWLDAWTLETYGSMD